MPVGIVVSGTQQLTNVTKFCFFHLEIESKEIHRSVSIKASQFPLSPTRFQWCLMQMWIIRLQRKFVGKQRRDLKPQHHEISSRDFSIMKAFLEKFLVNPGVRIQKADNWRLLYHLPKERFTVTPWVLRGVGGVIILLTNIVLKKGG